MCRDWDADLFIDWNKKETRFPREFISELLSMNVTNDHFLIFSFFIFLRLYPSNKFEIRNWLHFNKFIAEKIILWIMNLDYSDFSTLLLQN